MSEIGNSRGWIKVRSQIKAVVFFVALLPLSQSIAGERETVEVPMMGGGDLAILSAAAERAYLVNTETAVERDGVVFYDQHARLRSFKSENGSYYLEFVIRIRANCNTMQSQMISSIARNFHTGKDAGEHISFGDTAVLEPISKSAPAYDVCSAINSGETLFFALTQNHYYGLQSFPRFALSLQDAFDIDEVNESGEVTEASESFLLQYLRENNPNF
tara:strand:+ start:3864 stop:4514 length:651 start_codon:yes stop_codon:yes gene_type:complete